MSKSLYKIQDELQQIINTIEENGGEIDEHTEEALQIKQEELETKIENYCNLITVLKSDVECCKNEKQRINSLQNTKKNIVDKLRERILEAVLKWGNEGKSGNKVLDLSTRKLFTKCKETFVPNEERIATFSRYFQSYLLELKKEGILMTGPEIDLTGMMGAINSLIKAEKGENYPPFTVNDLNYLQIEVSGKYRFSEIFDGSHDFVVDLLMHPNESVSISTETDNKGIETSLSTSQELNIEPVVTLGYLENKYSLTIK